MNDPYKIIKTRYVTEKSTVLENLHTAVSNKSVERCKNPKYIFVVDTRANKTMIAQAVEAIYSEKKVKVVAVNTLHAKPKPKRRGRGRPGAQSGFKKAIVTLEEGDSLDAV